MAAGLEAYDRALSEAFKSGGAVLEPPDIAAAHTAASAAARTAFLSEAVRDAEQLHEYEAKLLKALAERLDKATARNTEASRTTCEALLEQLLQEQLQAIETVHFGDWRMLATRSPYSRSVVPAERFRLAAVAAKPHKRRRNISTNSTTTSITITMTGVRTMMNRHCRRCHQTVMPAVSRWSDVAQAAKQVLQQGLVLVLAPAHVPWLAQPAVVPQAAAARGSMAPLCV